MRKLEYIYVENDIINVIQAKVSENKKIGIGYIVQTYHFSIEQVKNNDLKLDSNNCLDCPFSYNKNSGKSGGCYTHKGMQYFGLISMLKRLNKNFETFKPFKKEVLDAFIITVKNTYPVDLVRFGAYGEPVLLGKETTNKLSNLSKKNTGYTHQWKKQKHNWANEFLMSSVHDTIERAEAQNKGFRSFAVIKKDEIKIASDIKAVNCPASKESQLNLNCIKCGLCNGNKTGIQKDIFILNH